METAAKGMFEKAGTKGVIGACAGVLGFLYNSINELLVVLAMLMIFDYILGAAVAFKEGKWDKSKGLWGAAKKVLYSIVVAMGFLGDFTISYMAEGIGVDLATGGLLGIAVTLYLIGTEGFSNIKSLVILGIPFPPVLRSAFGLIKDTSGKIVPIKEGDEVNEEI